jgi:hypothetical protein
MSTRAVARDMNVHFSAISCLKCHLTEFASTSNSPHNHRLCVTTPAHPHPATSPAGSSGWWVLRSIYVCHKAFLWGKTNSDWGAKPSQWVGLAAKGVGLYPPWPTHSCTLPSGWAWLPRGWAYTLHGPTHSCTLPSHVKAIH